MTLDNPLQAQSIYELLNSLLELIIAIGFPIVVLFIVFIGFRFVQTSATGDTEGLKSARKNFFWAIVGALILLGAQALSLAIEATIGDLTTGL